MSTVTVVISIGRGLPSGGEMEQDDWDTFRHCVRALLRSCGDIYVDGAHSIGEWDGIPEESATYVAEVRADYVGTIRLECGALAHDYRQDAIALTVGQTDLVTAEA